MSRPKLVKFANFIFNEVEVLIFSLIPSSSLTRSAIRARPRFLKNDIIVTERMEMSVCRQSRLPRSPPETTPFGNCGLQSKISKKVELRIGGVLLHTGLENARLRVEQTENQRAV